MNRWNKILRVFTAEYLGLAPEPSKDMEKRIPEDEEARRSADELVCLLVPLICVKGSADGLVALVTKRNDSGLF
jgi:hypothetical protein